MSFEIVLTLANLLTDLGDRAQAIGLEFGVQWKYLIAQIVSFLIVLAGLYYLAFKPVLATIDERQKKIEGGLKYADEMKAKLAEAEQKQEETLRNASMEAQKIVNEARASSKALIEKQTREAAERAEQIIQKAQQATESERKKMLAEVREEIARLVILTSSKVLSRELSSDERSRYSEAAVKELDGN